MSEGTDVAAQVHGSPLSPYTDAEWWDSVGDEVEGYDLLRDEALFDLVGVPFAGFRVVFRDGTQRKGEPWRDDYASLELRVAPATVMVRDIARIQSRRKAMDVPVLTAAQAASLPGQQLVVNDGSTGIYRQITQYLVAKQRLVLPEGPQDGEKGECIFDLPRSQWLSADTDDDSTFNIGLKCSRGLRFSEYPSPANPSDMARTWYIA